MTFDGSRVAAGDRADVDQRLVGRAPTRRRGAAVRAHERDALHDVGRRRRRDVERGREHMRVRHRSDGDRIGRCAGRPGRPEAEVVAVVSGRDDRNDAGCGDVVDRLDERVVCRVDLRAATGEVDHVHAVLHRGFEGGDDLRRVGDVPDRRRHGEHAVVAEPGARCDAAQPGHLRMISPGGRRRAGVTGSDAGDMRAVERRARIDREPSRCARVRAREHAGDDHLGRRPLLVALREALRIGEAARIEERIRLVDPIVHDRDLHPRAVGSALLLEHVGADHRRRVVERERVRHAGIHRRDRAEPDEGGQLLRRQRHGEPIEHDLEAASDARVGDRASQQCDLLLLRLHEALHVRAGAGALDVQAPARSGCGEPPTRVLRERRQREPHDDANPSRRREGGEHSGADARQRVVAECSLDGYELRCDRRRGDERRATGEKRDRSAQGSGG